MKNGGLYIIILIKRHKSILTDSADNKWLEFIVK